MNANVIEGDINPQQVDELKSGEVFDIKITIAKGRWNSKSKDRNEIAVYTAPAGLVILGHEVIRTGHYSSASWVKTDQAGSIGLETGAVGRLVEKMREGLLKGSLTIKGKKIVDADGTSEYAKFIKEFSASFKFYAATRSAITFRWTTNTTWGSNGASIDAHAYVQLMKVSTEEDAERALEVIRFAIESGLPTDLMNLLGSTLGAGKTAAEVGIPEVRNTDPDKP